MTEEATIRGILVRYGVEARKWPTGTWGLNGGIADSHASAYLRWDRVNGFHVGTAGAWLGLADLVSLQRALRLLAECLTELAQAGAVVKGA